MRGEYAYMRSNVIDGQTSRLGASKLADFVSRYPLSGYLCAILTNLLMAAVRLSLDTSIGRRAPFGLFFVPVVLTSWIAGFGPGILSLVLGALLGLSFIALSRHGFPIRDAADWVGLINYILSTILIVILNERQRRSQLLSETNIRALNEKQAQLERNQAELEALNVRLKRAMQETHHRIKNNLQVVSALVELQVEPGETTVSTSAVKRIGTYVQALATIHDLLTQEAKSRLDADMLHAQNILDKLIPLLRTTMGDRTINYTVADLMVSARQGAALALLINELVSNAIKHGSGDIDIDLQSDKDDKNTIRLEVCDDGPGFPKDFDPKMAANTGLELIDSIGRWDLNGNVVFENRSIGGARIVVTFPVISSADKLPF